MLTIIGGAAKKSHVVLTLPATIGRSRQADLAIPDASVSRRHCRLFEVDGLLRVQDLGSLNGTLVAGEAVTEAPLRPSDQFTIGPMTFRVDYDYAGEVTAIGLGSAAGSPAPPPTPPPAEEEIGLAPEMPTVAPKKG
jgi:predicted component of type VI protein secretion system